MSLILLEDALRGLPIGFGELVGEESTGKVDNEEDDCGRGKLGCSVSASVAVTVSGASDKPVSSTHVARQ